VVKEFIHVSEHERRAPEHAHALNPRLDLASKFVLVLLFDLREMHPHRASRARHRAVIETQKAAQNRLEKRRATTTTHHAVGSRHRYDAFRWNEAFCSLFSSVFFQISTNSAYSNVLFRTTFCS
jgi:hypothetical protein